VCTVADADADADADEATAAAAAAAAAAAGPTYGSDGQDGSATKGAWPAKAIRRAARPVLLLLTSHRAQRVDDNDP
jgi:hypothetical protein